MDWIRRDPYYFESGNGQFRVSITYTRKQRIYTAWRRCVMDGEIVWSPILYTRDLPEAQRVCEEDS